MFKKPLGGLKTSAPLRGSDRRKLKQRVIAAFNVSPEVGDVLVPDGILSVKFTTHLDEHGTAYLAPGSGADPLWFSIGKSATEELIPTVYTLWKERALLPFVSTPAAVLPILTGGADLMIPGVIHHATSLQENQLVSICQFSRVEGEPMMSPPLAVGRMAVSGKVLSSGNQSKGKAVNVYHTWKDHLWNMGSKSEVPESQVIQVTGSSGVSVEDSGDEGEVKPIEGDPKNPGAGVTEERVAGVDNSTEYEGDSVLTSPPEMPPHGLTGETTNEPSTTGAASSVMQAGTPKYTPQNISDLLHASLLQALSTTLQDATFPMSSTQLYSGHILPARPSYPPAIVPLNLPAPPPSDVTNSTPRAVVDQEISIKTSSHKSLSSFLKQAEKVHLLTLKSPGGGSKHGSGQGDLVVLSVNLNHPQVEAHTPYVTIKDNQDKAAKRAAREEQGHLDSEKKKSEVAIVEFWKPHLGSVELFKSFGAGTKDLYTLQEVRTLLNKYIEAQGIVNAHDRAYINIDETLNACISARSSPSQSKKGKESAGSNGLEAEFMKREELVKKVTERMQSWHEVSAEGHDSVRKKGSLQHIQVVMKMRQGRKASTLITGFEPYLVINAEEMAEDLRKICAGSTSVSPIPGKPGNAGSEVFVQGKQSQAVVDYLIGKGIPKKWIEVQDQIGKKK